MRVPARRPSVVLFDVFETCLQLDGLRPRFEALGRPGHELELFFARLLHHGMALTLAGHAPPFAEVAADMLRRTCGVNLTDAQVRSVLDGFLELPVHPDVEPAFRALRDAGVPAYAFTHGSATVARAALERAGVVNLLLGVLSAEELSSFKPLPVVYRWACKQIGTAPEATALVAVHSWDTHGAMRAGLLAGFCTRWEGGLPSTVDEPHVVAPTLDGVVNRLLLLSG